MSVAHMEGGSGGGGGWGWGWGGDLCDAILQIASHL